MGPSWGPSWRRLILAGVCLAGTSTAGLPAFAQQSAPPSPGNPASGQKTEAKAPAKAVSKKKDEAGKAKLDPSAAQSEVEAGIIALGQGRAESAVTSLSNALASGSLPQAQTARALYYRGVAYRRTAKPAQAISDLTSALWIKGGLSEDQRADALQHRSAAYREAGLPDQAEPPGLRAAQAAAKPAAGANMFPGVAPAAPAASSGGGFFSSLFGGGSSSSTAPAPATPPPSAQPAQAPAPAANRPATVALAPSNTATGTIGSAAGGSVETRPATRIVPVISSNSSLPMGFQDTGDSLRHVEVSTQARAQPAAAAPGAVARAWDEPKVKQVQPPSPARPAPQVAAAQPAPPPPATAGQPRGRTAAATPAGGTVQVQVAAVRSAEEAQNLAARLQTRYGRELGGRAPVVDQTSVGSLGTLYRVQIGPFASARDTEPLCARLKGDGMDCRVIGQ